MDDRNRRDDPYDSNKNIHLDVHGIRKQFLDALKENQKAVLNAVEHSQSALMMRLDLIEKAIAKISVPSGEAVTAADKALMAASLVRMQGIVAKAKALDEMTS